MYCLPKKWHLAPIDLHEFQYRVRHLAELSIAPAQLVGDVYGDIAGPSFGCVEAQYEPIIFRLATALVPPARPQK